MTTPPIEKTTAAKSSPLSDKNFGPNEYFDDRFDQRSFEAGVDDMNAVGMQGGIENGAATNNEQANSANAGFVDEDDASTVADIAEINNNLPDHALGGAPPFDDLDGPRLPPRATVVNMIADLLDYDIAWGLPNNYQPLLQELMERAGVTRRNYTAAQGNNGGAGPHNHDIEDLMDEMIERLDQLEGRLLAGADFRAQATFGQVQMLQAQLGGMAHHVQQRLTSLPVMQQQLRELPAMQHHMAVIAATQQQFPAMHQQLNDIAATQQQQLAAIAGIQQQLAAIPIIQQQVAAIYAPPAAAPNNRATFAGRAAAAADAGRKINANAPTLRGSRSAPNV